MNSRNYCILQTEEAVTKEREFASVSSRSSAVLAVRGRGGHLALPSLCPRRHKSTGGL